MPGVDLDILASDVDEGMLERARAAAYPVSSLRELPDGWRERGFVRRDDLYELRPEYRRAVTLRRHDLRTPAPGAGFDLVLCRNVAFTYLAVEQQRTVLGHLAAALRPGGALVIGLHEDLPQRALGFEPWADARAVFCYACGQRLEGRMR
jgi:chemotaxis protein methyltransferase CheR